MPESKSLLGTTTVVGPNASFTPGAKRRHLKLESCGQVDMHKPTVDQIRKALSRLSKSWWYVSLGMGAL